MLKILLLIFSIFFITNCSSHNNKTLDKNDDQTISSMIEKGTSTKNDLVSKFGEPEKKEKNKKGQDVWTYSDDRTSLNPLNIVPITRTLLGTTGREKKLVVTFDKNNIVSDYILTNKDIRTKNGLLTMGSSDSK